MTLQTSSVVGFCRACVDDLVDTPMEPPEIHTTLQDKLTEMAWVFELDGRSEVYLPTHLRYDPERRSRLDVV